MSREYPVMKKPISVGKILNFNDGIEKYMVIESEGVCCDDKGFTLVCKCIHSNKPGMIGEMYTFDDRVFRDYNNNNIKIQSKKTSVSQSELALLRAIEDAQDQILSGTMRKLSDDCPDDCENFNTLSLLYCDDEDISDPQKLQATIFNVLNERFPEYAK